MAGHKDTHNIEKGTSKSDKFIDDPARRKQFLPHLPFSYNVLQDLASSLKHCYDRKTAIDRAWRARCGNRR